MKARIFLVALFALIFAVLPLPEVCAQAPATQPASPPAGQKAAKLEALATQLNLTPEQKTKLLPILKAEAPKVEAIKNNPSLTGMQKLQQLRALREQTSPQVQAILTPQQFTQLQEIRRQEVEKMIQEKRAAQ